MGIDSDCSVRFACPPVKSDFKYWPATLEKWEHLYWKEKFMPSSSMSKAEMVSQANSITW